MISLSENQSVDTIQSLFVDTNSSLVLLGIYRHTADKLNLVYLQPPNVVFSTNDIYVNSWSQSVIFHEVINYITSILNQKTIPSIKHLENSLGKVVWEEPSLTEILSILLSYLGKNWDANKTQTEINRLLLQLHLRYC